MTTKADAPSPILDWNELAPSPAIHECDCGYCDEVGQLEDVEWPLLVTFEADGVRYVTDRFIAIRADLAPIPEGYEGGVQHLDGNHAGIVTPGIPALMTQARGAHFRWSVIKAVEMTGWQLRLLAPSADVASRKVAVFAADNETRIGVAMLARTQDDDHFTDTFTRKYGDHDE